MSISKKILDEIERSDATEEEKQLMFKILDVEDAGTYQYVAVYEKLIKEHLAGNNTSSTEEE